MKRTLLPLGLARWLAALCSVQLVTVLPAATVNVTFQNYSFTPQTVTVHVGDTVMWTNAGGSHTVTGDGADPFCGSDEVPASCSVTFAQVGTYPYHCVFHQAQGMTGEVIVTSEVTPALRITSPTNNTTLPQPGPVTIEAAPENGVTLTMVEFFDGAQSLGSDTSSPFSIQVNLGAGSHSLTAKGTDENGDTATSDPVLVTVNLDISNPIPAAISKSSIAIELQPFVDGLVSPLGLAVPDDGSARILVYDQIGMIHVVDGGTKLDAPLLDVRNRLVTLDAGYDERGLLGVATHPQFAQKPFIYTYTSEPLNGTADFPIPTDAGKSNDHQSVVAEWRIDPANSNRVDVASRREILRIDKPQGNHNGGNMRFGTDGFLYFTVGDGGAADDQGDGHLPEGNAQNKSRILGKVVRIDVDARTSANGQYGVPADNPFVAEAGLVGEIYAYGLRNPYSFSFDRQTGELYLGDVGQNQIEEIDIITKGSNYGWRIKEGSFFFDPNGAGDGFVTDTPVVPVPAGLVDPIAEYDHDEGKAVIGGYVYRGGAISSLAGHYVTGDWGEFSGPNGRLFVLEATQLQELRIGMDNRQLGMWLKGFGEDAAGELYVCGSTESGPSGTSGKVLKLVSAGPGGGTNAFVRHDLIADQAGKADLVDTNLVNAWGIATLPKGPFWVTANHTGVSVVYNTAGAILPLVVTIPPPPGGESPASPTGIIFNGTASFPVSQGKPATFLFATEDGTIAAWESGTEAVLKADKSATGAKYKGLAKGTSGGQDYLYATDFHNGRVDVFGSDFAAATLAGNFSDPTLPAGFAPFGIENIDGDLYVTYGKQDEEGEDDVPGAGNGFVSVFKTDGTFVHRLISNGQLNSPWGFAVAPAGFGQFGGALLVGNFGDGRINAFDKATGNLLGTIQDVNGDPIAVAGLWGIRFGNGGAGGHPAVLYFAAGPEDEEHGLFGTIASTEQLFITAATPGPGTLKLSWAGGIPPYRVQQSDSVTSPDWTAVTTTTNTTATVPATGQMGFFRVSDHAPAPAAR